MLKNYYQILGLESNASKIEIKKAYRMYASKFHPDKQNGDKFFEERFKEILEAYEILNDESKRAQYDAKRTSDYSSTSRDNKHSYSKSESDLKEEKEQKERREKEERKAENIRQKTEKRKQEERRSRIYFTSKELSVNGLYVYQDGKSYLLDNYDIATLRRNDNANFIYIGIILIVVGILTIIFFIGTILIAWGIYSLFYKEYFVVLVNEYGDIPLIKGRKQKMKRIANKINEAINSK
ncbi:MAG: DnaJ domain-containing protein [Bacteroidota bacterium]|nr:DnaJ domain-containing protein [Bacteroidota bacterium]